MSPAGTDELSPGRSPGLACPLKSPVGTAEVSPGRSPGLACALEKSRRDDWKVVETRPWIRGEDREFSIAEHFEMEIVGWSGELPVVPTGLFVSRISTQDCVLG